MSFGKEERLDTDAKKHKAKTAVRQWRQNEVIWPQASGHQGLLEVGRDKTGSSPRAVSGSPAPLTP